MHEATHSTVSEVGKCNSNNPHFHNIADIKIDCRSVYFKKSGYAVGTLKIGLKDFRNSQLDLDSDPLGSKLFAWAEPDLDTKIILDRYPDLAPSKRSESNY
jgi:hypothetical protein